MGKGSAPSYSRREARQALEFGNASAEEEFHSGGILCFSARSESNAGRRLGARDSNRWKRGKHGGRAWRLIAARCAQGQEIPRLAGFGSWTESGSATLKEEERVRRVGAGGQRVWWRVPAVSRRRGRGEDAGWLGHGGRKRKLGRDKGEGEWAARGELGALAGPFRPKSERGRGVGFLFFSLSSIQSLFQIHLEICLKYFKLWSKSLISKIKCTSMIYTQ